MTYAPTLFDSSATDPRRGGVRHTDPATSVIVADNMTCRIKWGSERQLLLAAFASNDADETDGMTDEQAAAFVTVEMDTFIDSVEATRRCSELRKFLHIVPTDERRPKRSGNLAQVSRITDAGHEALRIAREAAR